MPILQANQLGSVGFRNNPHLITTRKLGDFGHQVAGHDRQIAIHFNHGVSIVSVDSDCQIGWQRPGRGGPNGEAGGAIKFAAKHPLHCFAVRRFKVHIHRKILAIFVFQFGFSKRRAVGDRPVHWLQRAIHQPLLHQICKVLNDRTLKGRLHSEVRIGVISKRQEALHLPSLQFHKLVCIGLALTTNDHATLIVRQLHDLLELALLVHIRDYFVLNGQSMAIPTRHVRNTHAIHQPRAHHDVLQDLVEQMPQVDRSIRVRRAVME